MRYRGWRTGLGILATGALLTACAPPEPVRIGFLGGLSGRVADLGIAGRDGAILAVEQRNAGGGVKGRTIELLVEDDQQDATIAQEAAGRLIARGVVAIVGPMTSAMAVAVVPQLNASSVVMVAPTVTTNLLTAIDDQFLRVVAPTAAHVGKSAGHYYRELGMRRAVVVFDQRNKAYAASWAEDFRRAFEEAGGRVADEIGFDSSEAPRFEALAARVLDRRPDGVVIVANSVDTALLVQKLRRRDATLAIGTSEWAATERLIELGGRAVEGVVVAQYVDRDSKAPAWLAFRDAYRQRFGIEPGFAGLTAFDATNVVLDALAAQKPGRSLKQTIIERREFAGAQSPIRFDAHGDTFRDTYLAVIRDGAFRPLAGN
jgi:branched-chain amino acid transport system substrate-binding protein